MTDETKLKDNTACLLEHLKDRSLAYKLVQAHHAAATADPAEAMKVILRERFEQVRREIDNPKT